MRVRVLFFGVLRDVMVTPERSLEVEAGTTAGEVVEMCRMEAAGPAPWGSLAVAVNEVYTGRERLLVEGDEVALLPPVSGGTTDQSARGTLPRLDAWVD